MHEDCYHTIWTVILLKLLSSGYFKHVKLSLPIKGFITKSQITEPTLFLLFKQYRLKNSFTEFVKEKEVKYSDKPYLRLQIRNHKADAKAKKPIPKATAEAARK